VPKLPHLADTCEGSQHAIRVPQIRRHSLSNALSAQDHVLLLRRVNVLQGQKADGEERVDEVRTLDTLAVLRGVWRCRADALGSYECGVRNPGRGRGASGTGLSLA
jgi:hypothetical protein